MNSDRNVKHFRKALMLTQQQMANVLGVDRAHLSRIERGERAMQPMHMVRFADALLAAGEAALNSRRD